jgi:hypothetical protein
MKPRSIRIEVKCRRHYALHALEGCSSTRLECCLNQGFRRVELGKKVDPFDTRPAGWVGAWDDRPVSAMRDIPPLLVWTLRFEFLLVFRRPGNPTNTSGNNELRPMRIRKNQLQRIFVASIICGEEHDDNGSRIVNGDVAFSNNGCRKAKKDC